MEDRARVRAVLATNEGKIRETARETGIPTSTVRFWRNQWDKHGVPDEIEDLSVTFSNDIITKLSSGRQLALDKLIELIPDETNAKNMATVFGILDDKTLRAKGMAQTTTETKISLPSADEVKELMASMVAGALDSAQTRKTIVDAEFIDINEEQAQKALPQEVENEPADTG